MSPLLPPDYRPSDDEEFMNPMQREYFRQKLMNWRSQLLRATGETLVSLQEESLAESDMADRATLETDRSLELRTRDRQRKLISKIDSALRRIDEGTYGYCEETDNPISLRRLEARPIATLSIEAQEQHERMERTHRDD
ncbi:MAG: RNA polymerase-binding protein DksA [Rhodospirillaceae bacterium]|nr:RNA polymerase-binding protein DksA [Rhodospirillaceae bacterium]MDD9929798.1 RNA polymerase-binding protein DksA [Rhodospirillaceae bacterium]